MLDVLIYSVIVPSLVFFAGRHILRARTNRRQDGILLIACVVFAVAIYLPSPQIHGMETQFVTHLLGGGVFTGLVWWYLRGVLPWQRSWWQELVTIFVMVSVFGVLNELYELFAYEFLGKQTIADTSYDLLANTLGAVGFYALYRIVRWL